MEDWLNSLRVASGQINLAGYAVSQALVVLLLTSLLVSNYISAQPARRLYQALWPNGPLHTRQEGERQSFYGKNTLM